MQVGGISLGEKLGLSEFVTAFYTLARLDLQFAEMCVETLAPTMLDLDVASKPPRLVADFDDTTCIDGQNRATRWQQKVHSRMPFEWHSVVGDLGMKGGVVTPSLEQQKIAFKRKNEMNAFRFVLIGELNVPFRVVVH